ncbi:MAG TPA: poly(R)-hydroxyalkanoic acid synthase subunit PhaE, partial [Pseudoxanthomonas sp.]|nr:poly(R)-hydroxyalkanoic acid synthase subunit PhaE [Pseudoxanthomonas sp.]
MANARAPGDFDSLVRQYWESWNGLLGGAGSGASAGAVPGMDAAALDWFGRIQRLAAQFADGGGSAGEVARAWRELLGGEGADPFALLRTLPGVSGNWLEQVRPLLDALLRPLREQQSQWLRQPAFGPAREHQERLQALALAWQEWERHSEAYAALLGRAGQRAFEVFERRLAEHDAPGKRLESARALFDLWID